MKKLRWCIIICFTIFVSLTYSEQTSVLDKINQSASVEKIIDQTSSSSLMDEACGMLNILSLKMFLNIFCSKILITEKQWNICKELQQGYQ